MGSISLVLNHGEILLTTLPMSDTHFIILKNKNMGSFILLISDGLCDNILNIK